MASSKQGLSVGKVEPMNKVALALTFAFAAAMAGGAWHLSRDNEPQALASEVPLQGKTPPALPSTDETSIAAEREAAATPQDVARKPALYARSRTATDLRLFVEAAKQEVESGGAYYAFDALLQCRLLREADLRPEKVMALRQQLAVDDNKTAKRRLASLDWLEKRCAGFTEAELGWSEEKFLLSWAVTKDPLMTLRRRAHQVDRNDTAARQQLLRDMLATQDPLLLEGVRGVSSFVDRTGDGEPATYLDGVRDGGLDSVDYMYAWKLAICGVAGSCTVQDAQLQTDCALAGECFDSVPARVQHDVGTQERFERISAVAGRLQQVISNRDVNALLPR